MIPVGPTFLKNFLESVAVPQDHEVPGIAAERSGLVPFRLGDGLVTRVHAYILHLEISTSTAILKT